MTQPRDLEILEQLLPQIPESIDTQNEIHYIFENKKFTQLRSIKSLKRLELEQEAIYVKLKQMIAKLIQYEEKELREEFHNFLKSLKFKYKKLDVLHCIPDLHNEFKLIPKLEFEQGQVTIIQFWANWCGLSIKEMQKLKQTISSNEQWVDKVQFIGISLDSDSEHWKQRLLDENLKDFGKHYKFPGGWNENDPTLMSLNFKGIPFIVILDNFNRIQYKGHPSDTNVENKVNELILITEQINEVGQSGSEIRDSGEIIQQSVADSQISQLLEDEEFQEMHNQLVEVLKENMNEYDLSGGEFKLEMIEQNRITHNDKNIKSTPTKRSQILLSYDINIELKEKTKGLLSQITKVIPESYITLAKGVFKDSQEDLRQSLKDMLMQHQIYIRYKEVKVTSYYYINDRDSFECDEEEVKTSAELNKDNQQLCSIGQFQKAIQQIKPVLQDLNNFEQEEYAFQLLDDIKKSFLYSVGDTFGGILDFEDSHGKNMNAILIGNTKFVQVMIYWSKQNIENDECIKRVVEVVKKNNWNASEKKVKIFALCCDKMQVNEKFKVYNDFDILINVQFCVTSLEEVATDQYINFDLPYYIVVDQSSIIRAIGTKVNIEEVITPLLKGQPLNRIPTLAVMNHQKSQAIQEYLKSNKYKNILNQLGDEYLFKLKITLTEVVKENQPPEYQFPEIEYMIRENKLPVLKPIMNAITQIIPKEQLIITEDLLKTFDVPFPGKQCHLCKKPLNKDMQQYYQPFNKYFLCCECAEHDDKSKVGLARYKCSDTLIFINAPVTDLSLLKDIDEYKIGKNLKIAANDPGSQRHNMMCNGCGQGSVGPRYIAANCLQGEMREEGHVDFCCKCFQHLRNKESEEAQKIIERNQDEGYNLATNCLFVRILFNHGYYEF